MITPSEQLSIARQCALLSISRSSWYHVGSGETPFNLLLMQLIDRQFLETPWYGSRQMARWLRLEGHCVGRKRIRRLMRLMGLQPIYRKPRATVPHPEHRVYPYLLRDLAINRPNHVWCADITYIPMERGFLYLVAIMDWYSRKVLAWRVSNSMDSAPCIEALEEAMARYGKPEIFNTDQGSQFTGHDWIACLKAAKIRISMDGKGRWIDNVFIERLWRSVKYECVYLNAFTNGREARQKIGRWIHYYNADRPHSSLDGLTPDRIYSACPGSTPDRLLAA